MKHIVDKFGQRFSSKTGEEFFNNDGQSIPIFHISSFHTLTQFIGFCKYINRDNGNVYMRGQAQLYNGKVTPSILRCSYGEPGGVRLECFRRLRNQIIKDNHPYDKMNKNILEPLIQHYGIKTDWLDIVDNLWVALWFGLYCFDGIIVDDREHIHICPQSDDKYAYIFMICSDAKNENPALPGVYVGADTKLVDLRRACPSICLRPHAQHALMLKLNSEVPYNYNDCVIGIARISVKDGFEWIGKNGLLSTQSLFPPTFYDHGYKNLLERYKVPKDYVPSYGSIQIITY